MFPLKAFLLVIMICVAKSDVPFEIMCKNKYTDLNNRQIDVSKYCSNRLCIEKCCGVDEILGFGTCIKKNDFFNEYPKLRQKFEPQINYSSNILSSRNKDDNQKNFTFLLNHKNIDKCTIAHNDDDYRIFENGSLQGEESISKEIFMIERLNYCIDFKLHIDGSKIRFKINIRQDAGDPKDEQEIQVLELVAISISSFFLLLVLVVYCLLPDLQNLIGRVLMAYISTLLVAFAIKLVIYFVSIHPPPGFCKTITPFFYYTAVSSFFWLNIVSYDVFRALRGLRKRCEINRRGERVKFMWYCLYAWGAPLLMTAVITTLDNIDLSKSIIYKPNFAKCFDTAEIQSVIVYFKIPIGVLIFINIVLFFLTVYNMWMVKRGFTKCKDAGRSKLQTNRLSTYTKLSVIMGVSWCLELLPPEFTLWKYLLINLYNLLTGVAIFFLFVFKKDVLTKLCRKFNILKDFRNKLESSQRTKSTRTSRSSTVKNSPKDVECNPLQNCPKEEDDTTV